MTNATVNNSSHVYWDLSIIASRQGEYSVLDGVPRRSVTLPCGMKVVAFGDRDGTVKATNPEGVEIFYARGGCAPTTLRPGSWIDRVETLASSLRTGEQDLAQAARLKVQESKATRFDPIDF